MKKILAVILVLSAGSGYARDTSHHNERHEVSGWETTRHQKHGDRHTRRNHKGTHRIMKSDCCGSGMEIYENMPLETKTQIQDVKSQYKLNKEKLRSAHHIAMSELETGLRKLQKQMDKAENFDPELALQYEELRTQSSRLRTEYHQKKQELKELSRAQAQKIKTDWLKAQV